MGQPTTEDLNPYDAPPAIPAGSGPILDRHLLPGIGASGAIWLVVFVAAFRPPVTQFGGFVPLLLGSALGARIGIRSYPRVLAFAMVGGMLALPATVFWVVAFQDASVAVSSLSAPAKWVSFTIIGLGFGFFFGLTTIGFAWWLRRRSRN